MFKYEKSRVGQTSLVSPIYFDVIVNISLLHINCNWLEKKDALAEIIGWYSFVKN